MLLKRYRWLLIAAAVLLILVILLAFYLGRRDSGTPEEAPRTAAGVQYLQSLEAGDPEEVNQAMESLRLQNLETLRDEMFRRMLEDDTAVWSQFEDFVLLGSSRAAGFSQYGFLPEDRVLAQSGETIKELEAHISDIVALEPSTVFLCYGVGDSGETPESYSEEFSHVIGEIQAALPKAEIYLSSILPVKEPAFSNSTVWRDIPQYNAAMSVMCQEIDNCWFVDCDPLADTYAEYYAEDGMSLQKEFYPYWAAYLSIEVYNNSLDWDGPDDRP